MIRILDRFVMYYIRTADKLMRTARWLEGMEGGIEVSALLVSVATKLLNACWYIQKLRRVILDDELGICADLEREMDALVGTYYDEWRAVVDDPQRQKQFRQFVNTVGPATRCWVVSLTVIFHRQDERRAQTETIIERGQQRPANWAKNSPAVHLQESDVAVPKSQWMWRKMATVQDLTPTDAGTTSAAVKYGDSQLAIFHVPRKGYFATQQASSIPSRNLLPFN